MIWVLDEVIIPESVLRRSYAFERFDAAAAVLDPSGNIVETNEAWRLFAALNHAEPGTTGTGTNYLDVCDRSDSAGAALAGAVADGLRSILRGERSSFELEYPCPSPFEDRWFVLHTSSAPVHDGAGVVLFHMNITARRLLEARLGAAAGRDPVTGFPDRRAAVRLVNDGLRRAAIADGRLTVMNVRVEGLETIDRDLGHPAGDELIVQVTARAMRAMRAGDHVCRLGGENLVIVCADLTEQDANTIVHRLRDALDAPFQLGAMQVSMGATIGIADAGPETTALALLAAAAPTETRSRPHERRHAPAPPLATAPGLPRQAAQAQRDAVLAQSSEIVLYFEPDGTIAWASPATRSIVGIDPAMLVGRNGLDMIHPDDQERAIAVLGMITGLGDHRTRNSVWSPTTATSTGSRRP